MTIAVGFPAATAEVEGGPGEGHCRGQWERRMMLQAHRTECGAGRAPWVLTGGQVWR